VTSHETTDKEPSMFDNVLVAYEGSAQSDDALALAQRFAGESARITAACAYWYDPRSARVGAHDSDLMRVDADAVLAKLRARDEHIELRPVPGPTAAAALHDLTEQEGFDLVVVGSTRRGALGRVVSGTTATTLLHGSPCAVAIAPAGFRDRAAPAAAPRIGVAYDGSPTARVALHTARDLAASHGASLAVLNAYDTIPAYALTGPGEGLPPDVDLRAAAQAELDEALAACSGVDATGELLGGRPTDALLARAADLDLLVTGSRGYGRIRGVVLGSMSRRLAEESPCALLVVPQPEV
jgi:nucleotide-binding universal stress UspA family protein